MSSLSSNLSAREEKFESFADVFLRGAGRAEATTGTIVVAASIADADHESLAIILKKTDVCCFELYPVNNQIDRKRRLLYDCGAFLKGFPP